MTTTTKPVGETIVAAVTIESATKRKRQTQRGEVVEWAMRLFIPALGIKQFSTPTSMDAAWASELITGETHTARLIRGKLKDGKTGQYDSDYWWEVAEWDTAAPIPVIPPTSVPSQDEYRRSKEEMRWTEALHMAATLLAMGVDDPQTRRQVIDLAAWFHGQLQAGPPQGMPQDDATIDAEPPPEPEPAPTKPQPVKGTKCPIPGHGGMPLLLVTGDPTPKHAVWVSESGQRKMDRWCYGV